MPILGTKNRNAMLRHMQVEKTRPQAKPRESKEAKPANAASRPPTKAEKEQADIAALSAKFHQAEADKAENSYVFGGEVLSFN